MNEPLDAETKRKYEKSIQVGTFLGGFIFAALTTLISQGNNNPIFCTMENINQTSPTNQTSTNRTSSSNSASPFCNALMHIGNFFPDLSSLVNYKQFLIGAIGLVGFFFIVSIYGMKTAIVHDTRNRFSETSHYLYEWAIGGIMLLFPLIVSTFSLYFGIMILGVAVFWISWQRYNKQVRRHV